MQTIIKINGKYYKIRTKKDLFTDQFQEFLKISYATKTKYNDSNKEKIYCQCKRNKYDIPVRLYTKEKGNKYYLSTYPNQKDEHDFDCPFNSKGVEHFIKEDDGNIELQSKNILFLTHKEYKNKTQKTDKYDKNEIKTTRNIKGFNHLMFILINESYSFLFNIKNKGKDRLSGDLENVEVNEFLKMFYKQFMDCKFKNGRTVKDVMYKENARIYTGIIEKIEINKDIVKYYENGKSYIVHKDIWYKANRFAKIYKNITTPPYFFVKIVKDKKIIRFFIFPVADKNVFIPVESNLERKFVLKNPNQVMYKPLSVSHIKKVLTKELSSKYFLDVAPDIRPDFFVFEKDKVKVVEVAGFNDDYYKSNLERKEKMYQNLKEPFYYERVEIL